MDEEKIIEQRKEKLLGFIKKTNIWVIGFLIIAIILGVYIRSMPMQDHSKGQIPTLLQFVTGQSFEGTPGLWDIATNDWTLGPDLDPWLFTRYAQIIAEQGNLPRIDYMRNVPLGFDTLIESRLLPYLIVWTNSLLNFFGNYPIIFSAALFPVIMFVLIIIVFFLFVREIFIKEDKENRIKSNIISLISTFFLIVIPVFLSRTIAGIPEKESAGFFFMFLTFYLFLKAWKSEKLRNVLILGILSGISTALMGLIWGGVIYAFFTIAVVNLIYFIIGKVKEKEIIIYCSWLISSLAIIFLFSNKYSNLMGLMKSNNGVIFITFFVLIAHFILTHTKLYKTKFFEKINLPENILSLIIAFLLGIIFIIIFLGPTFIFDKINELFANFINPTTGRWGVTVAENRQPYFVEWVGNFGPFIKNIAILFWLSLIGSVVLFKKMTKDIKKKDSWILTCLYLFALLGLIFSRYAPHPSLFDGENLISKLFFFIPILLFIGFFIYLFMKYRKEKIVFFENIDFKYLFIIFLFFLCIFTARSAVRLIMVLGPIAPIFMGFLIIESISKFKQTKDETGKIIIGVIVLLIIIASIFTFWNFYKSVKSGAYSMIPNYYNQQWQEAMKWVREETPQNAVFGHWWDYGYWVQSIGNRATVLDGGNAISFWNYYMGRLVLTGDNQKDALEFLYNHNTTHFLIDSSDIGKYGAFSSIGSNENYDRLSQIGSFILSESQTQETKDQNIYVYTGGIGLDEDLIINDSGKEILLPQGNAAIGAIIFPIEKNNSKEGASQPYAIAVYQNKQYKVNLRYLYLDNSFVDFKSGIEATAYIFPKIIQTSNGISSNKIGASMYLSPRLMRGMLTQKYILNDPFNKFSNFKLVHTEQNIIIKELNKQGMNLPEFIYYEGIQGPIKIWEIEYTGEEKIKTEYLDTDSSKYLSWRL